MNKSLREGSKSKGWPIKDYTLVLPINATHEGNMVTISEQIAEYVISENVNIKISVQN